MALKVVLWLVIIGEPLLVPYTVEPIFIWCHIAPVSNGVLQNITEVTHSTIAHQQKWC